MAKIIVLDNSNKLSVPGTAGNCGYNRGITIKGIN